MGAGKRSTGGVLAGWDRTLFELLLALWLWKDTVSLLNLPSPFLSARILYMKQHGMLDKPMLVVVPKGLLTTWSKDRCERFRVFSARVAPLS